MHPSTNWLLARQHGHEQRLRAAQAAYGRLPRRDRPTRSTRSTLWARRSTGPFHRLSVWCGYRMIGLGCRLARPALVPTTGVGA
jgi:hypothetical protein